MGLIMIVLTDDAMDNRWKSTAVRPTCQTELLPSSAGSKLPWTTQRAPGFSAVPAQIHLDTNRAFT